VSLTLKNHSSRVVLLLTPKNCTQILKGLNRNYYIRLLSYREYVLETGEIKYHGKSEDFINSPDSKKKYLDE